MSSLHKGKKKVIQDKGRLQSIVKQAFQKKKNSFNLVSATKSGEHSVEKEAIRSLISRRSAQSSSNLNEIELEEILRPLLYLMEILF